MKIKWLGHSCFLLISSHGTRIVTDPFNEKVGYKLPNVEADIVTSSHGHYDHNHIEAVRGDFQYVKEAGKTSLHGIDILGVPSFHDEVQGAKRGQNIIYVFDIDGIRICHLGDLGHVLGEDLKKEIGPIDVLLLPVGGTYTIDYQEALEVRKALAPKVTIPMHFRNEACGFPIDGVDKFLEAAGKGVWFHNQEIEMEKDKLSGMPEILILDYQ